MLRASPSLFEACRSFQLAVDAANMPLVSLLKSPTTGNFGFRTRGTELPADGGEPSVRLTTRFNTLFYEDFTAHAARLGRGLDSFTSAARLVKQRITPVSEEAENGRCRDLSNTH